VERGLGEQAERVRLLLRHRRRLRRNVGARRFCRNVLGVRFLIQRVAGRGQRLDQHGAVSGSSSDGSSTFTADGGMAFRG